MTKIFDDDLGMEVEIPTQENPESISDAVQKILDIMKENDLELGVEHNSDGIFITLNSYELEQESFLARFDNDCCEAISIATLQKNFDKYGILTFKGEKVQ